VNAALERLSPSFELRAGLARFCQQLASDARI
jgi:hypothetical protein